MTVFIVLISNHNTAFYTWHELNCIVLKIMSDLYYVAPASKINVSTLELNSSSKYRVQYIVIYIDQYYKKNQSLLCNNALTSV